MKGAIFRSSECKASGRDCGSIRGFRCIPIHYLDQNQFQQSYSPLCQWTRRSTSEGNRSIGFKTSTYRIPGSRVSFRHTVTVAVRVAWQGVHLTGDRHRR
ncbi:hypothetical protein V6N11_014094 [Hibiscus sabdariffa]|uniref:Uncharacterized protein n=1 Tax=Hibiscus sabdariffa TaxID=183260 RepID=A0ABR2AFS3_9ROSI